MLNILTQFQLFSAQLGHSADQSGEEGEDGCRKYLVETSKFEFRGAKLASPMSSPAPESSVSVIEEGLVAYHTPEQQNQACAHFLDIYFSFEEQKLSPLDMIILAPVHNLKS